VISPCESWHLTILTTSGGVAVEMAPVQMLLHRYTVVARARLVSLTATRAGFLGIGRGAVSPAVTVVMQKQSSRTTTCQLAASHRPRSRYTTARPQLVLVKFTFQAKLGRRVTTGRGVPTQLDHEAISDLQGSVDTFSEAPIT
jgi:hypothetical protein